MVGKEPEREGTTDTATTWEEGERGY